MKCQNADDMYVLPLLMFKVLPLPFYRFTYTRAKLEFNYSIEKVWKIVHMHTYLGKDKYVQSFAIR